MDEVMFTHYKQHYAKFRKLTIYPKFLGDCPGGCHYHRHPSDIFWGMNSFFNENQKTEKKEFEFRDVFLKSIPGMKVECYDFIKNYMPEIDKEDFWRRCSFEFPYKNS